MTQDKKVKAWTAYEIDRAEYTIDDLNWTKSCNKKFISLDDLKQAIQMSKRVGVTNLLEQDALEKQLGIEKE